jgi:hypothetical protein
MLSLLDDESAYKGRFIPRCEHRDDLPLYPMNLQVLRHVAWQSNAGVFDLELGADVLLELLECLGIVCTRCGIQSLTRGLKIFEAVPKAFPTFLASSVQITWYGLR